MSKPAKDDPQSMPPFYADLSQEDVSLKVEQKAPNDDFGKKDDKKIEDGESKQPPPQKNVGWDAG
jgi:hypothetical protein